MHTYYLKAISIMRVLTRNKWIFLQAILYGVKDKRYVIVIFIFFYYEGGCDLILKVLNRYPSYTILE